RRRHTRYSRDWSSDVCSSDLQWQKLVSKYHLWISVIGVILVPIAAYLFWKNKRAQTHKSAPSLQNNVIYQSETTDTETIDISANNLVEDETVVIDKNDTVTHTIANTEIATQTLETNQPKEPTTVL